MTDIEDLTARIRAFADARDWARFHTPKNLAMALAGEAGELLAELQWLSDEEIRTGLSEPELRARVAMEVADVFLYLVRFADVTGIDLAQAALDKLARNELRYPVEKSRGNATKHDRL
ncbi:nucleotide pyrophosphohydrolase [Kutzneria buriramensis]|uniref:NTP pyrophosphatase (Non-canonical NTP hydrolase) n=1 Tax=Kutzneria buriramensis TaxID=1045776 RepID=A0A3E0I9B8_9PSEU|nr:nucleotide pyrophosphohydrolase [Kutzneria buriramensis]REH55260.1 NTP pyrophosphatase (non-canonical NTP hydrolase) [Kutzneria buriramensis]